MPVLKDALWHSASSKESKCAFTRKVSVRVKLVCVSNGEVGSGMSGMDRSGLRGSLNNNSLGMALRAGRMQSFIWQMASSRCSGQLFGRGSHRGTTVCKLLPFPELAHCAEPGIPCHMIYTGHNIVWQ